MNLLDFIHVYLETFVMLFAIGPICLTVINFNISKGFKSGMAAGLGVVTADICYILIGSFFLHFIGEALSNLYVRILSSFTAIFLFYLAYGFLKKDKIDKAESTREKGYFKIFIKMFLLTISGPTTIFTYLAIFNNFIGRDFKKSVMILAASLATLSFYIILNILLAKIKKRFNEKAILFINKISAVIISIFGLTIIYKNIISLII